MVGCVINTPNAGREGGRKVEITDETLTNKNIYADCEDYSDNE